MDHQSQALEAKDQTITAVKSGGNLAFIDNKSK